jgi:hypothetical protein
MVVVVTMLLKHTTLFTTLSFMKQIDATTLQYDDFSRDMAQGTGYQQY